ncbi:hypothetical protein C2G38_2102784 [Gigaspora rosea]|uniref:Uncharacterized protein n=1 Tax=Gigaspora rosea TaxID=44941 RepID=A0A397UNF6_9GLOM|nr:hypothetical protein C2G38_2102784 [Gigaspora rosea]
MFLQKVIRYVQENLYMSYVFFSLHLGKYCENHINPFLLIDKCISTYSTLCQFLNL